MEKLSDFTEGKAMRNSVAFEEVLKEKGFTYADVYYRLNQSGITEFNDLLTKEGFIVQGEDGRYLGSRNFHSSDNGLRSRDETRIDCEIGNVQETLFCLDNIDFVRNPKATSGGVNKDSEVTTKELDLIHKPTGAEVEFKVSYSKMYGNNAYYNHRDGKFKEFLDAGNILVVYFVQLDKAAVICKRNLDRGSVKVKEKDRVKYNKFWDSISVWSGLMVECDLMVRGNSAISNEVSKIIKYGYNR